jgi:hypothetical protein
MSNGATIIINGKEYLKKYRDYTVQITHDAVAGSTITGTIQVDPSSPFIWDSVHMEDTNDPTLLSPGLDGQYENLISVQDQANNYNFSNDFVPRSAFARDRKKGRTFESEMLIEKNTKLVITIKNPTAGAVAGTTQVTLQGYSLY